LLGDDAALARHGLIVFFVLRHLYHLLSERSRGARLESKASAIRRLAVASAKGSASVSRLTQ
jgi:hypothetical protein